MSNTLFKQFDSLPYVEQAKAFLNAYFLEEQVKSNAENIWKWTHMFIELDDQKKAEGSCIDEFKAHRFLEKISETASIVDLRESLRSQSFVPKKELTLLEYLLFRFKYSIEDFVKRPQGDNSEKIAELQKRLEELEELLGVAVKQAEEAKKRANEAAQAAAEQKEALAEVEKQEQLRDARTQELTAQSENESLGIVAQNRAKNQLAQHLSEDPLPLRKAKITLQASTKKAEKARMKADEAAEEAEAKRKETVEKCEQVQKELDDVKKNSGSNGQGSLWWLQRELDEKKKYLPKRLQN